MELPRSATARRSADVGRGASALLRRTAEVREPSTEEVCRGTLPKLEKALAVYDRLESADVPESSWVPGRTTRRTCQDDLDTILDLVLAVLGTSGAAGYRDRIRLLRTENSVSQRRIAEYRGRMLSAPPEESQNFVDGLLTSSKESLRDNIADESDRLEERNRQIESLKNGFREHLALIGVPVSPETADSFLLPIEDGIVAMAAVIHNIAGLAERLQQLVDESREAPEETRRYYGMYLLLVIAVDRIQTHFVTGVDEQFLPRVSALRADALGHIDDARSQLWHGGPRETLNANIAANERTVEACRLLAETLQSQKRAVMDDNGHVRKLKAAAINTYRTARTSLHVALMAGDCEAAFGSLRKLRLPQLRPFHGIQLSEELERLAERVATEK